MLKIRLQRVGKKNDPTFRVVVTDHQRGPKSGDYVENVGSYNPHVDSTTLKGERIKHWLSVGAQASDTVHNILVKEGVIDGKKINVLPKKSPIVKEAEAAEVAAAPAEESSDQTADTPAEEVAEEKAETEEVPKPKDEQKEEATAEVPADEKTEEAKQ